MLSVCVASPPPCVFSALRLSPPLLPPPVTLPWFVFLQVWGEFSSHTHLCSTFVCVSSYLCFIGTVNIRWWWESVNNFLTTWTLYKISGPSDQLLKLKKKNKILNKKKKKAIHVEWLSNPNMSQCNEIICQHYSPEPTERRSSYFVSSERQRFRLATFDWDLFYSKECRQRNPEQRWREQRSADRHSCW